MTFLTESRYHDLNDRWGNVFEAKMGAEAFLDICKQIDLDALSKELRATMRTTRSKQMQKKGHQAAARGRSPAQERQPARVDDHDRPAGHPARIATHDPA